MKKPRFFLSAVILSLGILLASCATNFPRNLEPNEDLSDRFGFCHAGRREDSPTEGDFLQSLGASWVRLDINWSRLEAEQGIWNFEHTDQLFDRVDAAGMKILAILDYDVPWIHDDSRGLREIPPERHEEWETYVRTVVERYGHRIDALEIWNEPNFPKFWTGDDEDFFALTDVTLDLLNQVAPDIPVAVGSVMLHPVMGGESFLRRMADRIDLSRADAVSVHPYGVSVSANLRRVFAARDALEDRGFDGEFWITEIGFPTGGAYPHKKNLENQAIALVESAVIALAGGIELITWYELYDRRGAEEDRGHSEDHFGVAYPDRSLKPAGEALSVLEPVLNRGRWAPELLIEALPRGVVVYPFDVGTGQVVLVLWSSFGNRSLVLEGFDGDFTVYDVGEGIWTQEDGENPVRISSKPMIVSGILGVEGIRVIDS